MSLNMGQRTTLGPYSRIGPMENLGYGIVLFRDSFTTKSDVIDFLSSIREFEIQANYDFQYDENGSVECLVNKSGHRFRQQDIAKNCIRLSNYYTYANSDSSVEFFKTCDGAVYTSLLQYLELFPMLLPCIWWKTIGHPIMYPTGSEQGLHCDNDINYMPGFEPTMQLGSMHVVAAMCYLNDDFIGGEIVFPYAGISHKPMAGDILLFPANYICAHFVAPIEDGTRFSYLQYFGQGSSSPDRGISICEDDPNVRGGQVWMKNLFSDYRSHIEAKYKPSEAGDMLLPLQREFHSSNSVTQ